MSASLELYKFVKRLPQRDRSFYLLMRAYEIHVSNTIELTYDEDNRTGAIDVISSLFEDEILQLTNLTPVKSSSKTPVYIERVRNENAEISTLDSGLPEIKMPVDIESYHLTPSDKFIRPTDLTPFNMKTHIDHNVISILPKMNSDAEQIPPQNLNHLIDDPFAERLGEWASSFSLSSESNSDLSSEDD